MKSKIMKLSFCIVSVFVVLVSMCPIPAYAAADTYYSIACDKPTVTEYSGYVELLFEHKTSGYRFVTVLSWFFTPISKSSDSVFTDRPLFHIVRNQSQFRLGIESAEGVYGNLSLMSCDTGSQIGLSNYTVYDDESVFYHNVTYSTDYNLVGMHYYGDFVSVSDSSVLGNAEFYVTYAEDSVISYGLNQVISALYSLIAVTNSDAYKTQLDTIISNLNSFEGSFEEFEAYYKTQMGELLSLTNSVLGKLDTIIQNTGDTVAILEAMSGTLIQLEMYATEIWYEMFNQTAELQALNQKLQTIIEILQSKGESDLTQPDTSNLDGYYDVEQSLLDDSNVDPSQVLNIELNENALSAIWNLVDRVLNVNPKVFGAVIIILALGILALILGR